jgi:hypothetical protein
MDKAFGYVNYLIAILIVIAIGGAIIALTGFTISSTTIITQFSAIAGVPTNLGSTIQTVNYVILLENSTSTNSTTISIPDNHTITVTNSANLPSQLSVQHTANLASANVQVRINGQLLGTLSDNSIDTYTVPAGYITNGVNLVTYG